MTDRITFFINRLREKLWVRHLLFCLLSVIAILAVKALDYANLGKIIPDIDADSIDKLITIITSSMLVIATLAVASMLSSYAAASQTATPRCFSLVIADDRSQNALSTFIGSFIFSIVAYLALKHGFYGKNGLFGLFVLVILVLVIVIYTFVKWTDQIARLGRLGSVIEKVENAAATSLRKRKNAPALGGAALQTNYENGIAVFSDSIGYIQHINIASLQSYAEEMKMRIVVAALPGIFAAPGRPLAHFIKSAESPEEIEPERIAKAFLIGNERMFDEDPRFGLIVLSEIGSRALSPAVNDPGTAIAILNGFVRLFALWNEPLAEDEKPEIKYDRVEVPELNLQDMFNDAFHAIARDGASNIEVSERLQKALVALASNGNAAMRDAANRQAKLALARAELALQLPEEKEIIRKLAASIS